MKRIWSGALSLLVLFSALLTLAGCSRGGAGQIFRYDIPDGVSNLDPQFTTDSTARMIISNIYEGLLVAGNDGALQPGAAEAYTVSADGLSYRFVLREALWSDGTAVTAHDFVFAFRRLFSTETASPWAGDYRQIQHAEKILSGGAGPAMLGVRAREDHILEFTLEQADPLFLHKLAETPAMPCREEFFLQTLGRYGLEGNLLTNGPFQVHTWDNEKNILLRPNEHYTSHTPLVAGGVNLYIGRGDAVQQLAAGASDLAALSTSQFQSLNRESGQDTAYDKTMWCIVFNQRDSIWGNALLRQSLFHSLDYQGLEETLPEGLYVSKTFIPPAMRIGEVFYREMAEDVSSPAYQPERALSLYEMGLQGMELEDLPPTLLYVPDTGSHSSYMSIVRKGWRNTLSVTIDLEPLPPDEIEERLRSGNYQMLLMPFSPADGHVDSLLGVFSSGSGQNYFGYHNPMYDEMLLDASRQSSLEKVAEAYALAESRLLSDAVVIPVYVETTHYATAPGVSGVEVFPYGERVYFKNAWKE